MNLKKNYRTRPYWDREFLGLRKREDEYFQTENLMKICKNSVKERLPEEVEVD